MLRSRTYVYVISESAPKPIKIGYAEDVKNRLQGLQCGNCRELQVRHSIAQPSVDHARVLERMLHEWFAGRRLMGEWFDAHWKEASIVADKLAEKLAESCPEAMMLEGLPEIDTGWGFSPDVA